MSVRWDAVVVGAGPYGLSTAAHLRARGLRVAIQGKPLSMWRDRMPKGMMLRSHWWATNLSDPQGDYSFARFFQQSRHRPGYPISLETFIEYGLWFQQHVVPDVDETQVTVVERNGRDFQVTLADGRELEAPVVVAATGLTSYAHRPAEFANLPPTLVTHSSDHGDFSKFNGKRVVVVGGGQSAVEYAALLQEAGATVHLISRRPLWWLAPDRMLERSWLEKVRAPSASIAEGWKNWGLDHMPYAFYRLSRDAKDAWNGNYRSGASAWLRNRVLGKVKVHDGHTVTDCVASDGGLVVTVSDGTRLDASHMMLATGFRANLDQLGLLDQRLRSQVRTESGVPVLNHWFESSAAGLYFMGFTSIPHFGPLYRFVAGAPAAARRVARDATRRARDRSGIAAAARVNYAAQTAEGAERWNGRAVETRG
jgi:thioredoxin reductase